MPDPLDPIVEPFLTGQWTYVESLPTLKASEGLHIDYSRKEEPGDGALSVGDRRQLAIALSGFANSEGGVLVWGVDARREGDLDQVQRIEPIREVARFISEINAAIPELVSFPIAGLRVIPILQPLDNDTGVVLVVVPQSDTTPHMARAKGQQRYYLRAGSQFLIMEHYQVADMFGRRAHAIPSVNSTWAWSFDSSTGTMEGRSFAFRVSLSIRNTGRGLLRLPCLSISRPEHWMMTVDTVGPLGAFRQREVIGWWMRWAAGQDVVVYPNDEVPVVTLRQIVSPGPAARMCDLFTLRYSVVGDGVEEVVGEIHIPGTTITWQLNEIISNTP